MFRIIRELFHDSRIRSAMITALIFCILYNSVILIHKIDYCSQIKFKAFLELSKDFFYIYAATLFIFLGLTIHRFVFIIGSVFLFITGALCSYYLFLFKIAPSRYVVKAAFDSNIIELSELTSTRLILWLLLSVLIVTVITKLLKISNWPKANLKAMILSNGCSILSVICIISPPYIILKQSFPIQYLHNSYQYFVDKSKTGIRFDISKQYNFIDKSDDDIIAVLVIGETARFDHFSINGYHRDTTPHLKNIPNLISFKAQSSANLTNISIPSLLSRHPASELQKVWNETGLLSIFTKLGFSTSWVGTQSLRKYYNNLYDPYEEVLTNIIPGGSFLIPPHSHDEAMLPFVNSMLNDNTAKKFIVVHTMGSHWAYEQRYPKEFARYQPECASSGKNDHTSCKIDNLINSYDNTILYTDFFLSKVIELLKSKNALLIYVSDHGESLGENGHFGHGSDIAPPEQTSIPFMIWYSDIFQARHQNLVTAIENHKDDQTISHDNIFHSVFNCLGIKSEIIDDNLSLCKTK